MAKKKIKKVVAGPVVVEIREDSAKCKNFQLIFKGVTHKGRFRLVL